MTDMDEAFSRVRKRPHIPAKRPTILGIPDSVRKDLIKRQKRHNITAKKT